MPRTYNNFNLEALNDATFSVDMNSLKGVANDKFPTVVAEHDGKLDVVAVCSNRDVADVMAEMLNRFGVRATNNSRRANPYGVDLSQVLDENVED